MKKIITEIKKDIEGEQLLFEEQEQYTEKEKELIIKSVAKRMVNTFNYCELIREFLPKLADVIATKQNTDSLINEIFTIRLELGKAANKSQYRRDEDLDFITYTMSVEKGYKQEQKYSDIVLNNLIDVEEIRDILDEGRADICFHRDYEFLITNNFLLSRYPEFYSDEDLKQIKAVATEARKRDFSSKEEYEKFKVAKKATLRKLDKVKNKVLLRK